MFGSFNNLFESLYQLVNEIDHRSGDSDLNQNYSQEGNLSANVDLTQHAHIESRSICMQSRAIYFSSKSISRRRHTAYTGKKKALLDQI